MGTGKTHTLYIIVIVILLLVIAGGYYYFHKKVTTIQMQSAAAGQGMPPGGKPPMGIKGKGMGMSMMAVTPPPLSDQQNQQIAQGTSPSTTKKYFNLTAGNFYFVPNKITVNKGDQVTFYVTNAGGVHDLVIDEFGVKTPISKTATTETYTFTASKTGSFVYYCSVPGHRQKGMWGTLVVQ